MKDINYTLIRTEKPSKSTDEDDYSKVNKQPVNNGSTEHNAQSDNSRKSISQDKLINQNKILKINTQLLHKNHKLNQKIKELTEQNEAKDKFLRLLAHDLKGPFCSIMGLSELVLNAFDNSTISDQKEIIKLIYESSKKSCSLIDNLLEWAATQLGQKDFKPEYFRLEPFIRDELKLMGEQAFVKKILLQNKVKCTTHITCNKNMLRVVIRNLVGNAIKFTKAGGTITISGRETNIETIIEVADTGIGIPEHQLKNLFNIRKKTISRGTNHEKGTGIGLLMCKEYIDKHHGTLEVKSKKGFGSRFIVVLPKTW